MESKGGNPSGVFPHRNKPGSIHISQDNTSSTTGTNNPTAPTTLTAPLTPRIDISRASSSSYHEDSSPENVFDQVGTGTLQESTGCLELFQEDVDELRSSTEELFFMEKTKGQTECERPSSAAQVARATMIFKFDDSTALQQFNQSQYNRKDSGASEIVAFLNPSGRTSRISSVGSQGSAVSRLSGASGISRSPSPHKMLVETSFCGPKPIEPTSDASSIEQLTADIENVILARRGDPTKVVLAEGIELKDSPRLGPKSSTVTVTTPTITIKESAKQLTPAEAARERAREQRRKEIEALKVRLNEINQKQLAKAKDGPPVAGDKTMTTTTMTMTKKESSSSGGGSGKAASAARKKIIGMTPEGTEYTRIKLKPDHQYEDLGISPNEKLIEESDFVDSTSSKRKKDANKATEVSKISPTTYATDNRSPSPASASVSRKSSFCSFFRSKDAGNNDANVTSSSKSRSSSKTASGGGRTHNDKSPLPSPSKSSSLSSRIGSLIFKPNRTHSPSQTEANNDNDGGGVNKQKQITTKQPLPSLGGGDKKKLKYYESDVVHIPLHTPPEEKEFKEFKTIKKAANDVDKIEIAPIEVPPITSQPSSSANVRRIAPTATIEKMQSTDEVELHDIPSSSSTTTNRKTSTSTTTDDRDAGSSMWSVEVQRHSSQESQETVISQQNNINNNNNNNNNYHVRNGLIERPAIPTFIDTTSMSIEENPGESQQQQQNTQRQPMSAAGRHKKHILFSTKIGSGSEEQIFCTQLSLSKTESQSSQLSEQASVFESPKNEENGMKMLENTASSLKHQSSSEVERVSVTQVRSNRSVEKMSDSDDAARTQQKRKSFQRDSGDFSSTKRESSDENEALGRRFKQRDSSDEMSSSRRCKHSDSPGGMSSRTSQQSFKQQQMTQQQQQQSSKRSSKMEISSESDDRESDMDGCAHKRNSRAMEDHESTGLVLQESFDDELPYVPTTLPEEKSSGLRIIPTKERAQSELITIPVERPRSTTPINPASLDNYCGRKASDSSDGSLVRGEKLRISLPRQKAEQTKENIQQKQITRRTSNLSNKSWTEFAEQQIPVVAKSKSSSEKGRKQSNSSQDDEPVPHKSTAQYPQKVWIDFDNIPEKRQPPKKITTIPTSKEPMERTHHHHHKHSRQYVSPEECQCECHESGGKKDSSDMSASGGGGDKHSSASADSSKTPTSEDSQIEDDNDERQSLMSDSSIESDHHLHHAKTTSNTLNLDRPFGMDLSVEFGGGGGPSNRSSIASQDIKSPDVILHK